VGIGGPLREREARQGRHGMAVYSQSFFARAGALLSYAPDLVDNFRRAATYVDRILRGAKPADLPVQLPTKFEMVVNRKTATGLGGRLRLRHAQSGQPPRDRTEAAP